MILFKIQMIKHFLSVELQQNNDELSISNFFFIWKFWKLNMSNFHLITGHPNN